MTTSAIRQKLQCYIETVEDRKVKPNYTMLENDIIDIDNHWNDKVFIKRDGK